MLKKLWNKFLNLLRKSLSIKKPEIDMDTVLDATGGPAKANRGHFTSFSGIDTKVYFEDENQRFLCVPEIERITCIDHSENKVSGTITTLIFDQEALEALPFKPKNMLMVACNEYGTLCYSRFKNIKLGQKSWSISIDDICTSTITHFEADECIHWKNVTSLRRYEDWPDCLPEQIQERLRTYK